MQSTSGTLAVVLFSSAVLVAAAFSPALTACSTVAHQHQRYSVSLSAQWKPWEKKDELSQLEEEVLASVQEKLDVKRVYESLQEEEARQLEALQSNGTRVYREPVVIEPRWKIACYAASALSMLSFIVYSNIAFAGTIWAAIFLIANRDPMEEDDIAGPLARIVGRSTLRSVEASQPKLRALVRAVVTGEEAIITLNDRVAVLEKENEELKRWKEQRLQIDDNLSKFTSKELKDIAKEKGLKVTGTKKDLLTRLVEARALVSE